MTAKIFKSAIEAFPQFDLAVAHHAEQLRLWREHMKKVETQRPDVPPIERYQPYGRPHAADIVEAAINANFDVDYEVVDDLRAG